MRNLIKFLKATPEEKEKMKEERAKKLEKEKAHEKEEALKAKERNKIYNDMVKYEKEHAKEEKIAPKDSFISLQHINKIYSNRVQAVFDFNLEINKHDFIVFVGPSGCGKSTTLRMIAGLEAITSGDLFIDGQYANDLEPKDRDISMVFQSYALYPHMTVYNNMAFSLKMRKVPNDEIEERVKKAAEILQLTDYLDRKPAALSGGQCQRVALGRAIVRNAKVFLMDEPLSNLDAKLRVQMRSEIVKLHETLGATTIYVTHDQTEAMTMASRIVVMNKGHIQQVGTPKEVYNHPANVFVATFIGSPSMNVMNAKFNLKGELKLNNGYKINLPKEFVENYKEFYKSEIKANEEKIQKFEADKATIDDEKLLELNNQNIESAKKEIERCQNALNEKEDHDVIFGVRPEDIVQVGVSTDATLLSDEFKEKIVVAELLGNEYYVHVQFDDQDLIIKTGTKNELSSGDEIKIRFNIEKCHIFDKGSEKYIH